MKPLLCVSVLFAIVIAVMSALSSKSSSRVVPDTPVPISEKQACLNKEGGKWTESGWLGNFCSTPWLTIAGALDGKDFVLEFEPGGLPFETTQASKDANRRTSVNLINALKVAATNRDKQILADVDFAKVAENEGNYRDQDEAENKLFADLKKIKVTGEEVISYDTASPLGQIITELERRLAESDAREAKNKAKRDAVAKAKRAAGGRP